MNPKDQASETGKDISAEEPAATGALAASADWVRELEQRVSKLEQNQPAEGAKFVTHDDLEKRLSESHPTTSAVAVAARLCPECGSPAHKSCKAATAA